MIGPWNKEWEEDMLSQHFQTICCPRKQVGGGMSSWSPLLIPLVIPPRPRQGKVDNRLLLGKTVKVNGKGWREGNR
jgi:hypothetical protein